MAAAAALTAGGCGEGEEETTTAATTPESGSIQISPPKKPAPERKAKANGDADRAEPASSSGEPVEGSKAAARGVPTSKQGDNSIQTYGLEAGAGERAEVTAAVQEFLDARAARNWATACSLLAAKPLTEYETLLKDSTKKGIPACAEVMRVFATDVPDSAFAEEAEIAEVLSLRVDDEYAFLIYTRPDGKIYATAVAREGGSWKIVSVGAAEIFA